MQSSQTMEKPLPEGWRWVKLGEICQFNYGDSLTSKNRIPGDVNVYGSNGIVGTHTQTLTEGPTIIIGRKGSIGEVHYSANSCWPIDTTYYIEEKSIECDGYWLFFCLKSLNLAELNKAAAVPGLNREDAYKLEISLPPLPEQQRIAALLREQMQAMNEARQAAEAQLKAINQLPAALLRQAFSGTL